MRILFRLSMLALCLVGSTLEVSAQPGHSADAALTLTSLLDARGLTSFAAADPDDPGRYVAALHIKGSQLLVVSARYGVPALMDARLGQGQYDQAYSDLQGAALIEGKWFVQDLQADGLKATRQSNEPFDLVYREGKRYVMLDGDWSHQHLTEAAYRRAFDDADERYARMLTILASALQSGGEADGAPTH